MFGLWELHILKIVASSEQKKELNFASSDH